MPHSYSLSYSYSLSPNWVSYVLNYRGGKGMKPRPKANPRRDPEPSDLSATRARIDREATT